MPYLNFSLSARADSQCVTHYIRQIAAPRRSTPNFRANFSLSISLMDVPDHQITTSSRTSAHTGVAIPYGDATKFDVKNDGISGRNDDYPDRKAPGKSTRVPRQSADWLAMTYFF